MDSESIAEGVDALRREYLAAQEACNNQEQVKIEKEVEFVLPKSEESKKAVTVKKSRMRK